MKRKKQKISIFSVFFVFMLLLLGSGYVVSIFSDKITIQTKDFIESIFQTPSTENTDVSSDTPVTASPSSADRVPEGLLGPYEVTRVVDGDTIVINADGDSTKVRMIGVDTPESVAPSSYYKENTPEGIIVSDYTKSVLENNEIYLEMDVSKVDKYDRTLAYVYYKTSDGTFKMFNEELLETGMGQIMTIAPNIKYSDRFYHAQQAAKDSHLGLWSDPTITN